MVSTNVPTTDLAESQLAAAMLDDEGAACIRAALELSPTALINPIPKAVLAAYRRVAERGEPLGRLNIIADIADHGELRALGGNAAVYEFADANWVAPTPGAIDYWITQVNEAALRRQALSDYAEAGQALHTGDLRTAATALQAVARQVEDGLQDDTGYWVDWDDESDLLNEQWMIRDLLPAEGAMMVRSEKNGGKSLFALTLAAFIAAGCDQFAERWIRTSKRTVVYVDGESSRACSH